MLPKKLPSETEAKATHTATPRILEQEPSDVAGVVCSFLSVKDQKRLICASKSTQTIFSRASDLNHLLDLIASYELKGFAGQKKEEAKTTEAKEQTYVNPILHTAEKLLKTNPALALERGYFKDPQGRQQHCSALEYAYRTQNFMLCNL